MMIAQCPCDPGIGIMDIIMLALIVGMFFFFAWKAK